MSDTKYSTHPELANFEETIGLLCFDPGPQSVISQAASAVGSAAEVAATAGLSLATQVVSAGYGYRISKKIVVGLTSESAKNPDEHLKAALKKVLTELETEKAVGICGESSLLLPLQPIARSLTQLPVMLSPVQQAAILVPAHDPKQKFAILTRYEAETSRDLPLVLKECNMELDAGRFTIVGVAVDESARAVVTKLQDLKAAVPELSGIICDSQELVGYADEIRANASFPVFDQITLLDFFHSARSDNPYFGTSYAHLQKTAPEKLVTKAQRQIFSPYEGYVKSLASKVNKDVSIGVLRIDYTYPPLPGDVASEASYGYKVKFRTVTGLTFEKTQNAVLDDQIQDSFKKAVKELEDEGVVAITGDCGFLMAFQPYVRSLTDLPVLLSSIIQAPMMAAAYDPSAKFVIFTANGSTFDKELLLAQSGVKVSPDQWLVIGLQDLDGFEAVALGEAVPAEKVQRGILARTQELMKQEPAISAILLECTELPHYADALRAATGLPVFDAITAIDYFQSSCAQNPGFTKKVLEAFLGLLNPLVLASSVVVVTAGTLGTVLRFGGNALKAGVQAGNAIAASAPPPPASSNKSPCCCTMQ